MPKLNIIVKIISFFGSIIGIDDNITFEGKSVTELETAFQEAVDDYLEMCHKIGKEPQKFYKGSFNVRIDPELHRRVSFLAKSKKISLNKFVKRQIVTVLKSTNRKT